MSRAEEERSARERNHPARTTPARTKGTAESAPKWNGSFPATG
ncbi:hypothetical protein [Archangium violaceum]|nr:hypothetical protein [Archangium violaceum]